MNALDDATSPEGLTLDCVVAHGHREVECLQLKLTKGQTVLEGLKAALNHGLVLVVKDQRFDAQSLQDIEAFEKSLRALLEDSQLFLSLWGEPCALDQTLHRNTRLELTKALRVDPKVARRERFQKQGAKAAGLFSKSRAGAKAGY